MASKHRSPSPASVALAGVLSLAVAMGIGRFAFTPQLPLMVQEGHLDVAQGGWLAAANYAGYLVGALTASRLRASAGLLALSSLAAVAFSTAAMALPGSMLWAELRFGSGVCSAWVFVATSVWCLGALAQQQRQDLSSSVYAGVGAGIAVVGLYCLGAAIAGVRSQLIWLHLGLLATAACVPVFLVVRSLENEPLARPCAAGPDRPIPAGTVGLVGAYGIMGFGYILPATFLPVLARSVVADPAVFGLAWPVFGATAAVSTWMAGALMRRASRLHVWASCQALMGAGTLLPSLWPHIASFVISAVLVGGTFMVITLAGVQEIRARVTWNPGVWVGHLSAGFALGQLAGPVVSALLLSQAAIAAHALDMGLQAAALCLFASAAWLWRQASPLTFNKEATNE
jgi:MFS family permease